MAKRNAPVTVFRLFIWAVAMMAALSHPPAPVGGQEKAATPPAAAPAKAGPINIGSRRELFVDDYLIDNMNGTRLKLHEPRCEGTVFRFDQPWDGVHCTYATVIRDDFGAGGQTASAPRAPVYRLYYVSDHGICVAESPDGIRWTRPEYDDQVFKDKETGKTFKMNRILSQFSTSRQKASFAPFIDTRPDVPANQRYKGFFGGAWGPALAELLREIRRPVLAAPLPTVPANAWTRWPRASWTGRRG